VYVQQTYKGIDVFNAIQAVAFKNGKLVSASGSRINQVADMVNVKEGKTSVTSDNAVRSAAGHLGLMISAPVNAQKAMNSFKKQSMEILVFLL
jgi:Zn-dependent metalloprotease